MSWMGGMFQMIGDSIQNNKNLTSQVLTNQQNRKQFKRDRALAYQREDNAIQRRVADARAAGVHPLFALGGSGALNSSPVIGPSAEAPRFSGNTGAALASMFPDKMSQETHRAAIAESSARTKLMNAQANDIVGRQAEASVGARAMQNANSQQDLIKLVPSEMTSSQSRDRSAAAGEEHPFYKTYIMSPDGSKFDLPFSQDPSEALENIPFWLWPAIVARNWKKYGNGPDLFSRELAEELFHRSKLQYQRK